MNWSKLCAGFSVIYLLLSSADPSGAAQVSGVTFRSGGPCALQDFPAGTALFPVKGRVIDDLTGMGISGATVRLSSICLPDHVQALAARMKQETVTDEDGSFSFQDLPDIWVSIVAEKGIDDYLEWPFRHRADDPTRTFRVGSGTASLTLQLAPAASISGVVRDARGAPMGDAWVSLWAYRTWEGWPRLEFWNAVKTNPDGSYARRPLPPGRYYLLASPDPYQSGVPFAHDKNGNALGLVPVRYPAQPENQGEDAFLELQEGQRLNVDFVLAPKILRHVTGRIEGGGKWGASITVVGVNGGQYLSKASTLCCDFETWVPNGRFRLVADYVNAEGSFTGSQLLHVNGADVSNVLVTLARPAETHIPIQIELSPFQKPSCLERALGCGFVNVQLVRHLGNGYFEAGSQQGILLNNRDRNSAVESVSALSGTYSVAVSTSMNVSVESVVRNSTDLMVEPLVVKPGDSGSPIQVVLAEGAIIEGTTMALGKPIRAWVYAIPERPDARLFQAATSDAQGKFRLEGLAPVDYTLFATEFELDINLSNPTEVEYWEAHGEHVKAQVGSSVAVVLQQAPIPAELYPEEVHTKGSN